MTITNINKTEKGGHNIDMQELMKLFERRDTSFRDAINNDGVGYFCISKEGYYIEVNDIWLSMYKYKSGKEIIGKHYRLSRTEEDFKELENAAKRVLKGATVNFGEVKRICKDGTVGYHTLAMTPVYINGKIEGFEGYIVDTTKELMAEHDLIKKLYKTAKTR
jgi:PAS domain S-box-containing protein